MSTDRDDPVTDGPGAEPGPTPPGGEALPGDPAAPPTSDAPADGPAAPPPAPAAPPAGLPAEVGAALAALSARLDREHERAAHREAIIDRLHEENQRLRRGELHTALEPVRAALYRLHDRARRESGRLAGPGGDVPADPGRAALLLEAVADDVADTLARLGVERFTAAPGDPYDASRHRPVAVTAVDDPAEDGTVVSVESDGFEQDGRVLRKAAVGVGRLDAARAATGNTAGDGTANGETMNGETMNTALGTDR